MSANVLQGVERGKARRFYALTREAFLDLCTEAQQARQLLPVHVQVKQAGVVLCARVLDIAERSGTRNVDFFQVHTALGVAWLPHRNVRACSGTDGRCTCEAQASGAAARGARREPGDEAPPLGNTGVAL